MLIRRSQYSSAARGVPRAPAPAYRPVARYPDPLPGLPGAVDTFQRSGTATPAKQGLFDAAAGKAEAAPERAVASQLTGWLGKGLAKLGGPGKVIGALVSKGLDLASVAKAALGLIPGVGQVLSALSSLPGVGKVLDKVLGKVIGLLKKVPGLGHVLKGAEKILGWVSKGVGKVAQAAGWVAKKAVKAVGKGLKKVGGAVKKLFKKIF